MTTQKLSGFFSAASMVMALLFTGNWAAARGQPPVESPPETEITQETEVRETAAATEPTQQETTQPPDPRPQALEAAAEGMEAGCVFVCDGETGELLYCSTGPEQAMYPASITKLFSAWVALRYLEPDRVITAGDELELVRSGSSTACISKGFRLRVDMLVEGMLLPSGNDAAYVLAAAAGREIAGDVNLTALKAVQVFVEEMNRQAEELGFAHTGFTNPDGYHAGGHYSCPEDVARMGLLALEDPVISRYAGLQQDTVTFESGQWITWYNTNLLLEPGSVYAVPGTLGLKTGYTGEAGYCLLAAFETERGRILVGIFDAETKNSRYYDAITLLDACSGEIP